MAIRRSPGMQNFKEQFQFVRSNPNVSRAYYKLAGSIIAVIFIATVLGYVLYFSNVAMTTYESDLIVKRVNQDERNRSPTYKNCECYEQKRLDPGLNEAEAGELICYGCEKLPALQYMDREQQQAVIQDQAFESTRLELSRTYSVCQLASFNGLCEHGVNIWLHILIFGRDHLISWVASIGATALIAFLVWVGPYKQYINVKDVQESAKILLQNQQYSQTPFTQTLEDQRRIKTIEKSTRQRLAPVPDPLAAILQQANDITQKIDEFKDTVNSNSNTSLVRRINANSLVLDRRSPPEMY
jgi:hypothetical protein